MTVQTAPRRAAGGPLPAVPFDGRPLLPPGLADGSSQLPADTCQATYARALLLWPGLDRGRLARTHGDPRKVARLVARRTIHGEDTILQLLRGR